jgi:hypothetical protein
MKTATLPTLAVLFAVPIVAVLAQTGDSTADHKEMMGKLNITSLRPGPAGRLNADGSTPPNYANYDERKATARSPVPPLLVMKDGRRITTPAMWEQHRKELFEIFDREFFGRLPEAAKTIKVTWEVTATTQGMSGTIPTITRTLVGHVDPTYYPAVKVDIAASVTTPASAAGKVPVIIQWGGGGGAGRGRGPAPLPTMAQLQTALSLTPEQIAASARDEDPDVVGLSILSGSHLALVPDIVERLRAEGVDAPVVVGGIIPEADVAPLKAAGVAAV